MADFLDRVLDMAAGDADMLGCAAQMAHCRTLAATGTAADRVLDIFHRRRDEVGPEGALAEAIGWIAAATVRMD